MKNEHIKNIPFPSLREVGKWLRRWEGLADYSEQEKAIDELFHGTYRSNSDLKNILIKCSVLNDFYSTNIFKVYPVAVHILSLDIDGRLEAGDLTLVDDIASNTISGVNRNFYSFATKYCSHHNPEDYPIYDSYVDRMLRYFRRADKFCRFENSELKEYGRFKEILCIFRDFYGLKKYSLKELDKYLWQAGKKYFPRKY